MVLLSPWLRDDDDWIVGEDETDLIQLACWATGVYDKETWWAGEIPDEVWQIVHADLAEEVTGLVEAGASFQDALNAVEDRL